MSESKAPVVHQHFSSPINSQQLERLERWARRIPELLEGQPTLALMFIAPECRAVAQEAMEVVQIYARVGTVVGCSGLSLIDGGREIEQTPGISVAVYHFPDTDVHTASLGSELFSADPEGQYEGFCAALGPAAKHANAWLLFADPNEVAGESWLRAWNLATGSRPTIGGFSSSTPNAPQAYLLRDGNLVDAAAVAVGLSGRVSVEPLLSQGCRPIGAPWVITEAENNLIHKIGNRPILEVLRDTLEGIPEEDKLLARGNVFVGLVHDEYKDRFRSGDFLVRNLAAIDPQTGAVAIASEPRIGQNLQFQIRDVAISERNLIDALADAAGRIGSRRLYGALFCNCIGRGSAFYHVANRDTELLQRAFPGLAVTGFFANGEFAPAITGKTKAAGAVHTALHGYSSAIAFFVDGAAR